MNFQNKTINIAYPIEAVQMNYLSQEQALVFGALKANGVMKRHELLKGLKITPLKLEKVLGLLVAVEKCRIEGDKVIFLASMEQAHEAVEVEASPSEVVEVVTEFIEPTVEVVAAPVVKDKEDLSRPQDVEEVYEYLSTHFNTANFFKLNQPDTDMHATAEKFFDFYEAKGWLIGKNKVKNWHLLLRRCVKDDNPWAVVKKNLMDMARQADDLRAQVMSAPVVTALPAAPQPLPMVEEAVPVNRDDQEREQFLKGKVAEKLGPRPALANFVHSTSGSCTSQERAEWARACAQYDAAFDKELELMSAVTDSVPTEDLYDMPF